MSDDPPKRKRGPGRRHPSGGSGWGGPAKGPDVRGLLAAPFEIGNKSAAVPFQQRDFTVSERRAQMMAVYVEVADDKDQPGMARIAAADKWLDRIEGKSVARNLNVNTDDLTRLTTPDLDAELARLDRATAEAAAREASKELPSVSPDVVH